MDHQFFVQGFAISAVVSLLVAFPNPAIALPKSTCEQGPNSGRLSACNELLRQKQSPGELAVVYRNRAQAYSWSGQYDLAVKDYDAALGIDPGDAEALYGRGWAFENVRKY